jgi:hypothetical protein
MECLRASKPLPPQIK